MAKAPENSEFFIDPPVNIRGGQVSLQELSSSQIMEIYERDKRMIYFFERAREREVVEEAEQILSEQSQTKEEE